MSQDKEPLTKQPTDAPPAYSYGPPPNQQPGYGANQQPGYGAAPPPNYPPNSGYAAPAAPGTHILVLFNKCDPTRVNEAI